MKATTREDLNLKDDETMCELCVHEDICRREQCGEPYVVIRSCFDFEKQRPHGEWIYHKEWEFNGECAFECSKCGMGVDVDYNFCPNCGADMKPKEGETSDKTSNNR